MDAPPSRRRGGLVISKGDTAASLGVLAAAFATKRFYSYAEPEDLIWILGPTTALLEAASGHAFTFEAHVGFVNRELALAVVPACAGVNFSIIAFSMLALAFVRAHTTPGRKALWVLASAGIALVATVVVNASRIGFGALVSGWVSPSSSSSAEQWHRIEGVVVYLLSLFVLFAVAEAFVERRRA